MVSYIISLDKKYFFWALRLLLPKEETSMKYILKLLRCLLFRHQYLRTNNKHMLKLIIGLQIKMKRLVRPFVYQYYLPCISIVLVSFMSFVVPLSAIPGRVALVVTQCLTLTNLFIHQRVGKILFIKKVSDTSECNGFDLII